VSVLIKAVVDLELHSMRVELPSFASATNHYIH
jgi:hypothetical protein